jgi:alpha-ketoglutaric semialdehyde dehydrogenase
MTVSAPTDAVVIGNVIGGVTRSAAGGETFEKVAPATGEILCRVARSGPADVGAAVDAAIEAQPAWAERTAIDRGGVIRSMSGLIERERDALAEVVRDETGKSSADAKAETDAAVEFGYFMAGEARRLYGKTIPSAAPDRQAMTIRQPLGVAGLIVAANTPLTNIAWKVFPALLCGNAAVLKASEYAPLTALALCRIAAAAGVPAGVLNLVHGYGPEAGKPLVEHPGIDVVSFTGSTAVGRGIARAAGGRLAKVSLALGGKNPLLVCDDADLARASEAAASSAFSNAGQRCASGSRLIVFDAVYEQFRSRLVEQVESKWAAEVGPVMTERQLERMLTALERARRAGATIVTGGDRLEAPGFYLAPTIVEDSAKDAEVASAELFGPIATLHRAGSFDEALEIANSTPFGLTAAVWTRSLDRAQEFVRRVVAGAVQVNGPTFGFEPHVPFGGERDSGTGWREPGTEALDVYSDWKTVYVSHDPRAV